jgi:transcriptional regulator with XRE-family HTH domain
MKTIIDPRLLRLHREAKGWDQLTLAQQAGVHPSVVSRLERGLQGDLRASVLINLAIALEVPVDALLPPTHQPPSPREVVELAALLTLIEQLPAPYQRQIAALLHGYLSAMPDADA